MKLILAGIAMCVAAVPALAQSRLDRLFDRTVTATSCELIPNNGRRCSYKFDDVLEFSIKDVGGTDTVIAFTMSYSKNELYAVMYFGCIAVVPGAASSEDRDLSYNVFISPVTGLVYKTSKQCRSTFR